MENKLEKLIEFLESGIADLYEWADDESYDDYEQHDCVVAAEELERVLHYVKTKLLDEE